MSLFHEPPAPPDEYAQPELRALLDRGVDPLKSWVCKDLANAPVSLGFHATSEWDNNVLACYLSHFLPKLPPTNYWQQDVLVVHYPEHWQNGTYNRIYTQRSGNCLIPDDFHTLLLEVTRAFGQRFIPVRDLAFWLQHARVPDRIQEEEQMLRDERLLQSMTRVEAQEEGTIERSTVRVLVAFGTLEWIAILGRSRQDHQIFETVHVKGEAVVCFDAFHGAALWRWFADMRHRGYLAAGKRSDLSLIEAQSLEEAQLLLAAERIQEVCQNKAIRAFLAEVWGNLEQIDQFLFGTTTSFAEEAISSIVVLDAQSQESVPDFTVPFWQQALQDTELQTTFDEAMPEGMLLAEVNTYLHRQGIFKAYGLPAPKSEHPAFQCLLPLRSLSLTYPRLFEPTIV